MGCGRRVTCGIEDGTAADRHDIGMTAEAGVVDRAMDCIDVTRVVLHRFAAGHDDDRRCQLEDRFVPARVLRDAVGQVRIVIQDATIEHDNQARRRLVGRACHDIAQQQVRGADDTSGEVDRILELDADFLPDDIHILPEGLCPSDSPTRSLARRFAGALRSRGSLAVLARTAETALAIYEINPS